MNTIRRVPHVALALLLTTGLLSAPAMAVVPPVPNDFAAMDTNKDGQVDKQEYMAVVSAHFDKATECKGYCTFSNAGVKQRSVWGSYQAEWPAL